MTKKVVLRGLFLRHRLVDDTHDVGLFHDQEFMTVHFDLCARPLAEQHAVTNLLAQAQMPQKSARAPCTRRASRSLNRSNRRCYGDGMGVRAPLEGSMGKSITATLFNFLLRARARTIGPQTIFCALPTSRQLKVKIFFGKELRGEHVVASTCLPLLMQSVEIDGEYYWDGSYAGNPAIYPLVYNCDFASCNS